MSDTWNHLRTQIEHFQKPFPDAAIAFANEHRAEVAPFLIDAIARMADDPALADDPEYVLHLYAMHLLAAWRETAAYLPMVRLGHHSEEQMEVMLGDTVTESYARCLASVCDGDLAPLRALAEDRAAGHWSRNAALDAWKVRVLEGDADRNELVDYLIQLGDAEAARLRHPDTEPEIFELLDSIASVASDIGAVELLERIRSWYADQLLDPSIADLPWFEHHLPRSLDECRNEMRRYRNGYIESAKKEISWWAGFSEPVEKPRAAPAILPVRTSPKIGRNEPCPCGSGKKYKKCCGA